MQQTEFPESHLQISRTERAEDRLRVLELEQTQLLARHEAVSAQLHTMRSTLRSLERLLELRLQRLEQLGQSRMYR